VRTHSIDAVMLVKGGGLGGNCGAGKGVRVLLLDVCGFGGDALDCFIDAPTPAPSAMQIADVKRVLGGSMAS